MVKPIPEGYHSITAHLVVNNATEAIEFYKHAFGAVEDYRYNGPDNKSILYVKLRIGDFPILLSQVSYPMSLCHLPNVLSRYSDTAVFCSSM